MIMRSCLAAMDVNANVNRAQATDREGAVRWKIKVDRAGKKFSAQPRKQEKCDAWKRDIVDLVSKLITIVFRHNTGDQSR